MSTDTAALSIAAVALLKGAVYRDTQEQAWLAVVRLQAQLRDHMDVLGLSVVIDEAEGYAYLRSKPEDPDQPIPRLVSRHTLGFHHSLLLALLRKTLAEFDATSGEGRLVLTWDRIADSMRTFLPESTNQARTDDAIRKAITRTVELGFLRPTTNGRDSEWEVRRVIKAFVDGQWLGEFDERLKEYAAGDLEPTGRRRGRDLRDDGEGV